MKYLKIMIGPIKIKGDLEDLETLELDLHEKVQSMIEAEVLPYQILDDEEDDNDD